MNKEISKRIEAYAKQLGKDAKELTIQFDKIMEDIQDEKKALTKLRTSLIEEEGLDRSNAVLFRGFVFADTNIIDFVEIMRNKAEAYFKDPILRNKYMGKIFTQDGTPLDTRPKVDFQDNPNYLNPLNPDEHSYYRGLFVIAGEGKECKNPKVYKLNNNNPEKVATEYMPWTVYDFRATVRKYKNANDAPEIKELNVTSVTKFKNIDRPTASTEIRDLFKMAKHKTWLLEDLETVWSMSGRDDEERKKTLRENPVLIEANVITISPKASEKSKSRNLRLDDAESESLTSKKYTCFLAEHIPIEFGPNSRLVFLASLDKLKNKLNDDAEELIINSIGYIPVELWKKLDQ